MVISRESPTRPHRRSDRVRIGRGIMLFALFIMDGLAVWAGSEAVPPASVIGMILAGTVGNDHVLKPDALEEKPQTDRELEEEDRTLDAR